MGNIGVLAQLIIKGFIIGIPILFLLLVISHRKSKVKLTVSIVLLIISLVFAISFFKSNYDRKKEESKKYLGYYKLDKLNGESCENCQLDLLDDNHYDIIIGHQIKGKGKWDLDFDGESGASFLILENGPHYMIFDTPREIPYINY